MSESRTHKIAYNGIVIALILLGLYGGTILRNNKIFFLFAIVVIGFIPYIIGGIKYGVSVYFSSLILAFIIVPNKLYVGVYTIFGLYPLIKLLAERRQFILEYLIKLLWFNASLFIAYILFKNLIYINNFFLTNTGMIIMIISLQLFFFGLDYFFNTCINYFTNRIFKGMK
jgi:hypothetical protein